MKKILLSLFVVIVFFNASSFAQATSFFCTHPAVEQIMQGTYDPSLYLASQIINHPDTISQGILQRINADTLKSYILKLATFHNRNTGSDTLSATRGFGAARNWVHGKFQEYSTANENRLLPSFFQFDQAICLVNRHKNIIAVLPGIDTTDKRIVLIEGHMDSRCEVLCDTACLAQGIEDNATGTALVMELARVMSRYSYNHTIVFMITTSEEQGLYGAEAFADYATLKG
ncbi:MAG: M28 family peptidase, partial [Bacteroidetes bacterium]|nr:M28 family peptidase [Bacteroidota bacterium]